MIDLSSEDTPAYSEISPLVKERGVQISVHPQALAELTRVFSRPDVPLVKKYADNLSLPEFLPLTDNAWGYGGLLQPTIANREGWTAWDCVFPFGEGVSDEQRWNRLFTVSAQLNVFYRVLEFFEGPADMQQRQLMAFILTTHQEDNGGSIGVKFSPQMVKFLATLTMNSRDPQIEREMGQTYEYLRGKSLTRADELHIEVLYRNNWRVDFDCPGDRSGLNPEIFSVDESEGYELYPHNMDSPVQQLTVLSGLAALHQKARLAGF